MIPRPHHFETVLQRLAEFPVAAIIGARQTGKTTIARAIAANWGANAHHFDLQDPRSDAILSSPMLALEPLRGLVVLDEIQRRPDLFSVLRVLADRPDSPARLGILGSASPELIRRSAESLAGRIAYHELPGIDALELSAAAHRPADGLGALWRRGGFPRALLAASDTASERWRREFIRTFLERDIPELGIRLAPATLRRFWMMLAHYSGQLWNGAELARALGVSEPTVRRYLDILAGTFMVRVLTPWYVNSGQRVVKSPKIYISDSGILHSLLEISPTRNALLAHPRVGASWEGFAAHQVVCALRAEWQDCYHWRTHTGAELDLLINRDSQRLGFEFKRSDSPKLTASMRSAQSTLKLDRLTVIHAGDRAFPLGDGIDAVPLERFVADHAKRPARR